MAIETAIMDSLGLMESIEGDQWLRQFLASGCILSSDSDRVWIGWGDVRRSHEPSGSRLSLFAPDFMLSDPRPWLLYEYAAELSVSTLLARFADLGPVKDPIAWDQPSHSDFVSVFNDIQSRISSGELSKAVPVIVRSSIGPFGVTLRAHALRAALKVAQRSPLLPYGFWTPEGEGMIGATPEILFDQRSGRDLTTMALAGTRGIGSETGSLLNDPKEMFEHRVVVDGIVDRLSPFGEVAVGDTQEVRLPALIHLHTGISVRAGTDVEFADWVEALHPTPAIGAWPREAGWRWLRSQTDASSRMRFGAPFGLIPPGQTSGRCVVAIRNVQWDATRAWVMAGSGIVGASKLEREWVELQSKLDSVQGALGI